MRLPADFQEFKFCKLNAKDVVAFLFFFFFFFFFLFTFAVLLSTKKKKKIFGNKKFMGHCRQTNW